MEVKIIGKNIDVTEGIKTKTIEKLEKLERYVVFEEDTVARVMVRTYPHGQKIEVTIPTKNVLLRAEVVHDDLYAAIDIAIDKLTDQIRRLKTKLSKKNKIGLSAVFNSEDIDDIEDEFDDEVVRTKTIFPEYMDIDEAIMRMEMLGHSFFIYNDIETNDVSVVYKRNDGGYGCLETE